MSKRSSKILVGDLLVKSELVTLGQFADAMPVSLKTGLPVGRVLIASGFLQEGIFKQVLAVQSLIRDQLVSDEAGIAALKLMHTENLSMEAALVKCGASCDFVESANRLGTLLVDAQVVDRDSLEQCLAVSLNTGLPLARVLVMRGYLADQVAYIALCAQSLVRDGKLERQRALPAIKLIFDNLTTLSEMGIMSRPGAISIRKAKSMRLGELLLLSGMVDDHALISAVEEGLTDEQPLGKVLTRVGLISEIELGQALALQEMVNNRTLAPEEATSVLSSVKESGLTLSKALSQSDKARDNQEGDTLLGFLHFLGIAQHADLAAIKQRMDRDGVSLTRAIQDAHLVHAAIEKPVLACYKLHQDGRLDEEQCAFAIQSMTVSKKSDLEQFLKDYSW